MANGLFPDFLDPRTQGLLHAGAGMMQAGGPSRMPISTGQALGQGLQGGMQGHNNAVQQQGSQQMQALQIQQLLAEIQRRKAQEEALRGLIPQDGGQQAAPQPQGMGGMPPQLPPQMPMQPGAAPQLQPQQQQRPQTIPLGPLTKYAISGGNPEPFLKLNEAARNRTENIDLGNEILTIDKDTRQVVDRKPKGAAPSSVPFEAQDVTPEAYRNFLMGKAARGATQVTVDTRQENEFNKKVGGEFGTIYSDLVRADLQAPANIGKYRQLGSLLSSVNTGKFKGATTELKAAAKGVGIDLGALGITDDVAPSQAARSLSQEMALQLRNPAGGAGMPGAMSDADRQFLTQMVPSLENDPQAIGKMIEYRTKLEERSQKVASMARAYRKKNNGIFDDSFFDELQDWSNKNPMFKDKNAPALGPQLEPGTIEFLKKHNIQVPNG